MKSTANMTLEDLARELPRLKIEARALWGEPNEIPYMYDVKEDTKPLAVWELSPQLYLWQYHLQQMVIAEDPIKYLGEHLA